MLLAGALLLAPEATRQVARELPVLTQAPPTFLEAVVAAEAPEM
jgi:hypothetical protein